MPVIRLLNRQMAGLPIDPEEAFEALEPMDAVVIGDPDACLAKMKKFAEMGTQRLLCFQQFGMISQPAVLSSMRLLATEVMPHLASL